MTHLIRRLARLLCVAGGCSLATFQPAYTQYTPQTGNTITLNAEQVRHEAMKVEVALLGDPVTMRLPLTVGLEDTGVVVKGIVPSEATRLRVLEVARQSCYLPVKDGLTVPSVVVGDTLTMKKQARDMLVRQLGSKADRFTITVAEDGQIQVEGEVNSIEEKLQVSRALRSVMGCSRVVNCLAVRGFDVVGKPITVIASDADRLVCSTLRSDPRTETKPELTLRQVQYSDEIYPPLPRMRTTVASGLPPLRSVSSTSQAELIPTSGCSCTQGAMVTHEKPGMLDKLGAWKNARTARRQQPGMVQQEPQIVTHSTSYHSAQPQPMPSAPVNTAATHFSSNELPQYTTPPRNAAGEVTAWPPAYRSSPPNEPLQNRPLATFRIPARQNASPAMPQSSQPVVQQPTTVVPATGPSVVQASSAPQARVVAPLAAAPEIIPQRHSAQAEIKEDLNSPPPIRMTEKELHKRVGEACGKMAKEVRIEVLPDQKILVHVYALPATEHLLVSRLLHVTELGARNVQLHVHLAN